MPRTSRAAGILLSAIASVQSLHTFPLQTPFSDFSGEAYPVEVHATTDYSGAGASNFSIFGTYGSGASSLFACYFSDPSYAIDFVHIIGSNYNDTLDNSWDSTHYLYDPAGGNFGGWIEGLDGADNIWGSYQTDSGYPPSNGYWDSLNGGLKADVIHGLAGNDFITGGGGADTIYGGDGDDVLIGDGGDDTIYGDDGNDRIGGNDGDDTLYGDNGNDVVCGGKTDVGVNFMSGCHASGACRSGDSDTLFQLTLQNAPTGAVSSGGTNYCGSNSYTSGWASGTCSYTLSSSPAECPQ